MEATNLNQDSKASTAGEDVRQERGKSLSPLDDLINALIELHKSDLGAVEEKLLERLPLRCRARSYLTKLGGEERISLETILTTAMRYVFLSYPPVDAVCWVSKHSQAVKLANELDPQSRFDRYSTNIRMVAEYLVESFGIPTPRDDTTLYDPRIAIRQIQGFREGELSSSVLEPFKAQGQVISAWGLVEQTLKLALGFYACHFSQPDWVEHFSDAVKKKSIGPIVQSLRAVESIFRAGEAPKERKHRKRKYDMSLKPIREGLNTTRDELKQKEVILAQTQVQRQTNDELAEEVSKLLEEITHLQNHIDFLEKRLKRQEEICQQEEQEAIKSAEQRSRDLRAECLTRFNRESPFADLGLKEDFRQDLGDLYYRNEFAHSPGDQIVEDGKVSESLQEAERIIAGLVKKRVVPMFIRVVGQGTDAYGRRTIHFVEECWMTSGGKFDPDKVEWFYPAPELKCRSFQRLLMIEPYVDEAGEDETWKEPIIEPVVYTPEDVISVIH